MARQEVITVQQQEQKYLFLPEEDLNQPLHENLRQVVIDTLVETAVMVSIRGWFEQMRRLEEQLTRALTVAQIDRLFEKIAATREALEAPDSEKPVEDALEPAFSFPSPPWLLAVLGALDALSGLLHLQPDQTRLQYSLDQTPSHHHLVVERGQLPIFDPLNLLKETKILLPSQPVIGFSENTNENEPARVVSLDQLKKAYINDKISKQEYLILLAKAFLDPKSVTKEELAHFGTNKPVPDGTEYFSFLKSNFDQLPPTLKDKLRKTVRARVLLFGEKIEDLERNQEVQPFGETEHFRLYILDVAPGGASYCSNETLANEVLRAAETMFERAFELGWFRPAGTESDGKVKIIMVGDAPAWGYAQLVEFYPPNEDGRHDNPATPGVEFFAGKGYMGVANDWGLDEASCRDYVESTTAHEIAHLLQMALDHIRMINIFGIDWFLGLNDGSASALAYLLVRNSDTRSVGGYYRPADGGIFYPSDRLNDLRNYGLMVPMLMFEKLYPGFLRETYLEFAQTPGEEIEIFEVMKKVLQTRYRVEDIDQATAWISTMIAFYPRIKSGEIEASLDEKLAKIFDLDFTLIPEAIREIIIEELGGAYDVPWRSYKGYGGFKLYELKVSNLPDTFEIFFENLPPPTPDRQIKIVRVIDGTIVEVRSLHENETRVFFESMEGEPSLYVIVVDTYEGLQDRRWVFNLGVRPFDPNSLSHRIYLPSISRSNSQR